MSPFCVMNKARLLRLGLMVLSAVVALSACGGDDGGAETDDGPGIVGGTCVDDLECSASEICVEGVCVEPGTECTVNTDCEPFELCNAGICVVRADSCQADTECAAGEICRDFACVTGCRQDTDCASGQVCNDALVCMTPPPECPDTCPEHQACVDPTLGCEPDGTCTVDGDCTGLDVCNDGICGEAPVTCERNQDCVQGRYCDRDAGLCEPGCRTAGDCRSDELCIDNQCTTDGPPACDADALEPNNTSPMSATLEPNTRVEGLTLCDESDWYSFRAFEGDMISISLEFTHDEGDINLRLYTPSNEVLQLSGGQEDGESLSRTINETGVYFAEVFGAGRGVFTEYALEFERVRNCPEDDSEENDTFDQATVLDPATTGLSDRFVCEADDDWYAIGLYTDETLEITLDFAAQDGDLTLELYDLTGETLLDSSDTEGDQEQLSWTATAPEVVLVRVPGAEGLINRYDLTTSLTVPECDADEFEPNDDAMAAAPLDGEVTGSVCAGDADWYSVRLPADVEVTASLSFPHADGDLSLELIGPDGALVLREDSDTDDETLTFTPDEPGSYALVVSGPGRTQNSYTLSVSYAEPSACPGDDDFEDNDDFDSATALEPGAWPGLVLCDGDEGDWYTFELEEGQSVEAIAVFDPELGAAAVTLYGPDATGADDPAEDEAMGDGPYVRARAQVGAAPGTWRVRVAATEGEAVVYSLRLAIYDGPLPLDCEFDDLFEPNDTPAMAPALPADQTAEAIVCGENLDLYRLEVEAGELLNIRADFIHAEGDIDLQLRDSAQSVVARAQSTTDNELIRYQAEASGTLFLEVSLIDDSAVGNRYELTISRIPGFVELSCVTDDEYEQNEDLESATPVTPGSYTAVRCAGDDDYYGLTLQAGQTLQATLLYDGDPDDLELTLYETIGGSELETGFATQQPGLRLTWTTQVEDNLALAITSSQSAEIPYTLTIAVLDEEPSFCGAPDALEPNTSPSEATTLAEPTDIMDLGLCGSDEDWFRIDVPAEMQLVVEANFDHAASDLNLVAFDGAGQGLAASTSTTGVERLVISGGEEGQSAVIRAFLADTSVETDVRYDLSMSLEEDMGGGRCVADEYEPNNAQAAAAAVSAQAYEDLSLCADDVNDWFQITLAAFQTLTVVVEYEPAEANLIVELIDPALGIPLTIPIDERPGRREVQTISFLGGSTLINVRNMTPELGVTYRMSLSLQ